MYHFNTSPKQNDMKTIFKPSAVFFFLTLLALGSCKKSFLEILPKGVIVASTVQDYDLLFNSQKLLNVDVEINASDAQVAMGDEVASVEPYFNVAQLRTQRLFSWQNDIYDPAQFSNEMNALMPMVYTFNKIINEIPNAAGGTEQQKQALLAEAKANRAWCYFMLVNYYGKPFNPATAATDPGYPIVTSADVSQNNFSRSSVKEVYDFIVNDLTAAIDHLPAQVTSRLRMSRSAARAILGKVYVFMGKFDAALPQFNAALNDLASASIPIGLYDYNTAFAENGEFMPIGLFGPNYPSAIDNHENLFTKQFVNNWTFVSNDILLSPQASGLYGPKDLRLNFYSGSGFFGPPFEIPGALRRIGPISTLCGVILPDLYLLNAECKARTGDSSGAASDVFKLRSSRMPAAEAKIPEGLTPKQMIEFILNERVREFAVQGYRWFDMRRLSVDPLFSGTTYTHTHYLSADQKETFTLRPERFTMRFPKIVIDQNPGMQNNP